MVRVDSEHDGSTIDNVLLREVRVCSILANSGREASRMLFMIESLDVENGRMIVKDHPPIFYGLSGFRSLPLLARKSK